jgi:hypothetical protein
LRRPRFAARIVFLHPTGGNYLGDEVVLKADLALVRQES